MISVIAAIELAEGALPQFLDIFHALVPKVHAEQGCIEYGPMIDLATTIDAQPPVRENVVTVVEKWESVEALEMHLICPHMIEYRKQVKDLVRGVTIHVLKPA